jgi:hypothetical protein
MNSGVLIRAVVVALALALCTADALAQFGGRGGRGGNRDQGGSQDSRSNRPALQESDTLEQMEYRLSLLEEDLRLQPTQTAAWDSFAGKVRAFLGDLARARARAMASPSGGESVSGVRRIEQAADDARNRATALDDIAAAAKALYATLTPDQRLLADVRFATIVAPQPRASPAQAGAANLPDLGSGGRAPR